MNYVSLSKLYNKFQLFHMIIVVENIFRHFPSPIHKSSRIWKNVQHLKIYIHFLPTFNEYKIRRFVLASLLFSSRGYYNSYINPLWYSSYNSFYLQHFLTGICSNREEVPVYCYKILLFDRRLIERLASKMSLVIV